ncbi:MAG: hypothetical protein ISR91_07335, partial [Candidatus Delongbacteria bacterium]|nr:hypothetical protein [Candidatus Delongbacteria bacterium]
LFHLQQAVELLPELYPARIALGQQLLMAWDLRSAEQSGYQAIRIEPVRPEGYHLLGDVALHRQQPDDALEWFRTALALQAIEQSNGPLLYKTGRCYWLLGHRDLALHYLLKAHQLSGGTLATAIVDSLLEHRATFEPLDLEDIYNQYTIDPTLTVTESVLAFIEETYLIEMENRNFAAALNTARKLAQIDSTQSNYDLYIIQALVSLGQLDQAHSLISTLPDRPEVQLELARLYVRYDSLELALSNYRSAWKSLPHTIDLELEIGELYLHAGLSDSALVYFQSACAQGDLPACEQARLIEELSSVTGNTTGN